MILSVSRRTDIPSFYTEWFINRLNAGYVCARNPINYHQVSKISLNPEVIDCIVFWTKNAEPLLNYIPKIATAYPFYFQYTLNGYGQDIEQHLPSENNKIAVFKELSSMIGKDRIIWRYDPVLLSTEYTVSWHIDKFDWLANQLKDYTDTCVFSFIDLYDKVKSNTNDYDIHECSIDEMNTLAKAFSTIAKHCGITLQTCAEAIDLDKYGIKHGCCIDRDRISKLIGSEISAKKDKNQRETCGCLESIDIGQYNTCRHGCRYCYATFSPQSTATLSSQHDPSSDLLIGHIGNNDIVTERKMKSLRLDNNKQLSLFDNIDQAT